MPLSLFGAAAITDAPNYSDIKPDSNALPGGPLAQTLLGGLMFMSLLITLAGLVLSAGIWAVGSYSSNYSQQVNGKRAFFVCLLSAFFIGAAYKLVAYFYGAGSALH